MYRSTSGVIYRLIESAGHFPWIEDPRALRSAFADLAERMQRPLLESVFRK